MKSWYGIGDGFSIKKRNPTKKYKTILYPKIIIIDTLKGEKNHVIYEIKSVSFSLQSSYIYKNLFMEISGNI